MTYFLHFDPLRNNRLTVTSAYITKLKHLDFDSFFEHEHECQSFAKFSKFNRSPKKKSQMRYVMRTNDTKWKNKNVLKDLKELIHSKQKEQTFIQRESVSASAKYFQCSC